MDQKEIYYIYVIEIKKMSAFRFFSEIVPISVPSADNQS